MNARKAGFLNIIISLVFALLIIASSWWFKGTDYESTIPSLIIAIWWVPFSILLGFGDKCKCNRISK